MMEELRPCGMCGAPWAQMCQEGDERIATLEAERDRLKADIQRLQQVIERKNERIRVLMEKDSER